MSCHCKYLGNESNFLQLNSLENVQFLLQADKVTAGEFCKILNSPIECDQRKTS